MKLFSKTPHTRTPYVQISGKTHSKEWIEAEKIVKQMSFYEKTLLLHGKLMGKFRSFFVVFFYPTTQT
jgi:hypothetical protein